MRRSDTDLQHTFSHATRHTYIIFCILLLVHRLSHIHTYIIVYCLIRYYTNMIQKIHVYQTQISKAEPIHTHTHRHVNKYSKTQISVRRSVCYFIGLTKCGAHYVVVCRLMHPERRYNRKRTLAGIIIRGGVSNPTG